MDRDGALTLCWSSSVSTIGIAEPMFGLGLAHIEAELEERRASLTDVVCE